MPRALRSFAIALGCVALVAAVVPSRASDALARVRQLCGGAVSGAHLHRGGPEAIVSHATAGPYDVSLWATPDVGAGALYVVLVPRRGVPFVAPRDVQVHVRPASGALPERRYWAYPETVRHGARFAAAVPLPAADTWQVRVTIDGVSGPAELRASFASVAPAAPGAGTLLLSAAPFFLVAGLWRRSRLVRPHRATPMPASTPTP